MPVERDSRRAALAKLVIAGTGLVTAGLAALVGVFAAPLRIANPRTWRRAASPDQVTGDSPLTVVLTARDSDGWYQTQKQSVIFLDRDGSSYRALSAICSHLGCRVKWDNASSHFRCPCHGGVYDREGRVLAGPPPRGLERLNVRINPRTSDVEVEL